MTRNRTSARQAGSRFERSIADHLASVIDDRIDRRVLGGSLDKGDIGGVRTRDGHRVVIECKDTSRTALATWIAEAHTQAANDGALLGVIVHKRHGIAAPGSQWVTLTLDDFAALLTGRAVN